MAKDSVLNATLKVQSRLTKLESIPNNNEKKSNLPKPKPVFANTNHETFGNNLQKQ